MASYTLLEDLAAKVAASLQSPGTMALEAIERMNAPYRSIEQFFRVMDFTKHVNVPYSISADWSRAMESIERMTAPTRGALNYADSLGGIAMDAIERMNAPFRSLEKSVAAMDAMARMAVPPRDVLAFADSPSVKAIAAFERMNFNRAFLRDTFGHGTLTNFIFPDFDDFRDEHEEPLAEKPVIVVGSAIVPEKPVAEGVLVKCTSFVWASIVHKLKNDWQRAFEIPPRVWEEIIAGAFKKAEFDEVILTPRSGDHGRDIIAVRNGVGSIRILGSVKAYKPGHLITKEEVHALMGVVAIDPNASKGIFATTSDFAPLLLDDPRLAAAVPHRIELMNGKRLQQWLKSLLEDE